MEGQLAAQIPGFAHYVGFHKNLYSQSRPVSRAFLETNHLEQGLLYNFMIHDIWSIFQGPFEKKAPPRPEQNKPYIP